MTEAMTSEERTEMNDHVEELRKRGMITSLAKVPGAKTDHIEALRAEVDALREALKELITWVPSADTYRRLGFDPEAPMRALGKARAALAQHQGEKHE